MSDDKNEVFSSFMTPKSKESSLAMDSSVIGPNKTKEALEQKKAETEEEKKKELEDAKKNSIALANRYKSVMVEAQARNIIRMLPFIILFVIIFLIILFKGGEWLQKGIHAGFNKMLGQ